jgi:hypothetical protein
LGALAGYHRRWGIAPRPENAGKVRQALYGNIFTAAQETPSCLRQKLLSKPDKDFEKALCMNIRALIIALTALGAPAAAQMVMTLDWPSQTREGAQYQVEIIGYDSEISGNMWITASPNEALDLPLEDAAKMCIFAYGNSKPIAVLRGPFHDEIIPVVPNPETGKICISLFAQGSGTWTVEF